MALLVETAPNMVLPPPGAWVSDGRPVSVLIVDDQALMGAGLRSILQSSPDIHVVGGAQTGPDALIQAVALKPMVVLLDTRAPQAGRMEAIRGLKAQHAMGAIIMMSRRDDGSGMLDALQAGASAYLLHDCSRELLLHTIAAVANGGALVQASSFRGSHLMRFAGAGRQPTGGKRSDRPGLATEPLTSREEAILRLVADGTTNRGIADVLCFAEVTIKKHVQTIIGKLSASDRTHAAVIAVRAGLID